MYGPTTVMNHPPALPTLQRRNNFAVLAVICAAVVVFVTLISLAVYYSSTGHGKYTANVPLSPRRSPPSPRGLPPPSRRSPSPIVADNSDRERRNIPSPPLVNNNPPKPDPGTIRTPPRTPPREEPRRDLPSEEESSEDHLSPEEIKKLTSKVTPLLTHLKAGKGLNNITDSAEIKSLDSLTDDDFANIDKLGTVDAPQIAGLKQLRSELRTIRTKMQGILSEYPDWQVVNLDDFKYLQEHKNVVTQLEGFDPNHIDAIYKSKPPSFSDASAVLQKFLTLIDELKNGKHAKDSISLKATLDEATNLRWFIRQNFKTGPAELTSHKALLDVPFLRTYILKELIKPEMFKACQQFFMNNQVDQDNTCATKLTIFQSLMDPLLDGELAELYEDKVEPKDLIVVLPPADKNEYTERIKLLSKRVEQIIEGPVAAFSEAEMLKRAQDYVDFNVKTCNGIIKKEERAPLYDAGMYIVSLLHDPIDPQACSVLMNTLKCRIQDAINKYQAGNTSKPELKMCLDQYRIMLGYRGLQVDWILDRIQTTDDVDVVNYNFWTRAADLHTSVYDLSKDKYEIYPEIRNFDVPTDELNDRFFRIGDRLEWQFMEHFLVDEMFSQFDRLVDVYGKSQEINFEEIIFVDLLEKLRDILEKREVHLYLYGIYRTYDKDSLTEAFFKYYKSPNSQIRRIVNELRSIAEHEILDFPSKNVSDTSKAQIDIKVSELLKLFNIHSVNLHFTARKLINALTEFAINPDDNSVHSYIVLKGLLLTTSITELDILLKYLNYSKEVKSITNNLNTYTEQSEADAAHAKALRLSMKMRSLEDEGVHYFLHHLRPPVPVMPPRIGYVPLESDKWYNGNELRQRIKPFMSCEQSIDPFNATYYPIVFEKWRTDKNVIYLTRNDCFQLALWSMFSNSPFALTLAISEPNDLPANVSDIFGQNGGTEFKIPNWTLTYLTDHRHTLYWDNDSIHMMIWTLRAQKALYTFDEPADPSYRDLLARYRQFQQKAHNPTGFPKDEPPKRDRLDVLLYQILFTPLVTEAIEDINREKPQRPELLFLFINCSAFPHRVPLNHGIYPGPPAAVLIHLSQQMRKVITEYYYVKDFSNRDKWLKFWDQQLLFGFSSQAMLPLVEQWSFDHKEDIKESPQLFDNLLGYAFQNRSVLLYDQLHKWCPGSNSNIKRSYDKCNEQYYQSPFCERKDMLHVRLDGDGLGKVDELEAEKKSNELLSLFHRTVKCLFRPVWNWRWMRMRLRFDYHRFGVKEETSDASGVANAAMGFVGKVLSLAEALLVNKDGRKCISNIASVDALQMWIFYLVWTTYENPGTQFFFHRTVSERLFSLDPIAYKTDLDSPIIFVNDDGKDPLNFMVYDIFFDFVTNEFGRDGYTKSYVNSIKNADDVSKFPSYMYQFIEIAPNGFKRNLLVSIDDGSLAEDLLINHWGMDIPGDVDMMDQFIPAWFAVDYVFPQINTHMRYGILKARYIFLEMLHRVTGSGSSFLENNPNEIIDRFKEASYELEGFLADVDYSDVRCSNDISYIYFEDTEGKKSRRKQLNFNDIANPDGKQGIKNLFEYFVKNDLVDKNKNCEGKGLDETKLGDPKEKECRDLRQKGIDSILNFATGNTIRNTSHNRESIIIQCIEGEQPLPNKRQFNSSSTCFRTLKIRQARSYEEFKEVMLDTLKMSTEDQGAFGKA